jgi:hypothetical protein
MLILYATEITKNKHCDFRLNRSTTDNTISIGQLLQKGWNDAVSQFLDVKKAYDSFVILNKLNMLTGDSSYLL